jgi:hypothetical protein
MKSQSLLSLSAWLMTTLVPPTITGEDAQRPTTP